MVTLTKYSSISLMKAVLENKSNMRRCKFHRLYSILLSVPVFINAICK